MTFPLGPVLQQIFDPRIYLKISNINSLETDYKSKNRSVVEIAGRTSHLLVIYKRNMIQANVLAILPKISLINLRYINLVVP